jgi:hypothetical protein
MSFEGQPSVLTMKTNHYYFPTTEWSKDSSACDGWKTTVHGLKE